MTEYDGVERSTATETFRAKLDERDVEWMGTDYTEPTSGHATNTSLGSEYHDAVFVEYVDGTVLRLFDLTPEQAIAATLGPGTCKIHDCEGSFSAVNRPVWRCDCGAFMTQYTDATTYHKPRFCPNCGRRIVEPTTNDVGAEVDA